MFLDKTCTIIICRIFPSYELELEWVFETSITGKTGLYDFALLWSESNCMIIKRHRACFLNSSQFTLTFDQ